MHHARCITLFAMILSAGLVRAETSALNAFVEQVRAADGVEFRFRQVQHIAQLGRPLESQGRIVVVPASAILWQTDAPFPDRQLLTLDGRILLEGGAQAGGHAVLTRILVALFRFDFDTLREYFEAEQGEQGQEWWLSLTPTSRWLESELAGIRISGARSAQQVVIHYADGSRSDLRIQSTNWLDGVAAAAALDPWAAQLPARP